VIDIQKRTKFVAKRGLVALLSVEINSDDQRLVIAYDGAETSMTVETACALESVLRMALYHCGKEPIQ
jgi:hypothetical protein